jgi:glycosyltransferase involved in cell wall biosynthesis
VAGTGRYENYLRSIAKPNVIFLGRLNDYELRDEYSGAQGFIYPQLEDFGMMPLEAASSGTATIAIAQGGSLETVISGVTGELLPQVNEQTLREAVQKWQAVKYDTAAMRAHSQKFSKENFKHQILEFVNKVTHENSH